LVGQLGCPGNGSGSAPPAALVGAGSEPVAAAPEPSAGRSAAPELAAVRSGNYLHWAAQPDCSGVPAEIVI